MSTDTTAPAAVEHTERGPLTPDELAAVIGGDIPPGSYVNLGIGQPTKIADYLPTDAAGEQTVILHTENGMLGMGPTATGDQVDPDLTNAGKVPVTELPGTPGSSTPIKDSARCQLITMPLADHLPQQ